MGVEKITLNGRVRMTMKPLMDEMPIVAAIQVHILHEHAVVSLRDGWDVTRVCINGLCERHASLAHL